MLHHQKHPMQVRVAELREPLTIAIRGDEPWLESIYESFTKRAGGTCRDNQGRLTGELCVTPIPGDVVHVTGKVNYVPQITCGRCGDDIAWPVDASIDAYYEDEETLEGRREINLAKGDLERYFIEDGIIDLESLVNEAVQIEIDPSCVRASDDGSKCLVCDADLSAPIVYREDSQEEKISPFAVLGAKKLKH